MARGLNPKSIARLSSILIIIVSIAVLFGWAADIPFLKSVLPGFPVMAPNAAATFFLCGTNLLLNSFALKGRWVILISAAVAILIFLIGSLTLSEYIFHYDAGIDTILLPVGDVATASGYSGRMAPHTSANLAILGLAFLALMGRRKFTRIGGFLTLACLLLSFAALLWHLNDARQVYGFSNFNSMAVHTAVLFILCCIALYALNTHIPIVRLLISSSFGGFTARWFAATVIILPTVIDRLQILGATYGWYDAGFGSSLSQFVRVIVMCSVVLYIATRIHKLDFAQKVAERDLADREQRFRELFENGQSMICIHDLDGVLQTVNPATLRSLGYDHDEVVGRNLVEFLAEDFREHFPAYIRQIVNEGIADGTFPLSTKTGERVVWKYHSILVSEPNRESYVLGNAQDITSLAAAQKQLKHLSQTDDLTGLSNRRGFQILAEQQIKLERHSGTARGLTLMFADLDGLKQINDKYGHDAGSEAIIAFAKVLRSSLRSADLVARWGGDEFVMLTIGSPGETSDMIVERIYAGIEQYNSASNAPYKLACSIRATALTKDSGESFDSLIAEADAAMYEQKRRRKAILENVDRVADPDQ